MSQKGKAWLNDFEKYEREITELFNQKNTAEHSPRKTKQDVEDLKKKIAEKLSKAEEQKIAAQQITFRAKVDDAEQIEPHEYMYIGNTKGNFCFSLSAPGAFSRHWRRETDSIDRHR